MVAMMGGWEKVGEWAGPDYFPPYGGDEAFAAMCRALNEQGDRAFTFGLSGFKLLIRRHIPKSVRSRSWRSITARGRNTGKTTSIPPRWMKTACLIWALRWIRGTAFMPTPAPPRTGDEADLRRFL